MKRKIILSLIVSGMLSASGLLGQTCNLVIDENFNQYSGSYSNYTINMLRNDFNGVDSRSAGEVRGFDGDGKNWPADTRVGNGVLRANFPANIAGGTNCGFLFDKRVPDTEEATMEYRVRFEGAGSANQFEWAAGGKLPGLAGSSLDRGIPVGCTKNVSSIENGFSARLMWRRRGELVVYTYFPDRTSNCGVDYKFFDAQPNTWYTVRQYIKLNTPGVRNGILEMYVNGVLKLRKTDVLYRLAGKGNVKINDAIMHTYRGGGATDTRFHSPNNDHIQFDDFKVWVNCANPGVPPTPTNKLPVVSVTSPANNATINLGQTVNLAANASDADGSITKVNFKINDSYYSTDVTSPYSGTWTPTAAGTYKVAARAFDNSGAATETSVTVIVKSVTRDCNGVINGTAKIDACGVCSGGNTGIAPSSPKTWYADADGDGLGDAGSTVQNCNKPAGYVAAAGDQCPADKSKTTPGDCGCGVAEGTCNQQAPTVSFAQPSNGATLKEGSSVTVIVDANDIDGSVANVKLFINGTFFRQENVSPYEWNQTNQNDPLLKNLSAGTYSLRAVAIDNDGNTSEKTITILVEKEVVVSNGPILGADCASKNGTVSFELSNQYRRNATGYSWWVSGSSSSISSPAGAPYKSTIVFGQYFRGGEVCVGVNLSVAPYYISYCKTLTECPALLSADEDFATLDAEVYPNPAEGNDITVETTLEAGAILELKVLDAAGLVKYQSTTVQSGDIINLSNLGHGTYYMHIVCENGVIVKKLTLL